MTAEWLYMVLILRRPRVRQACLVALVALAVVAVLLPRASASAADAAVSRSGAYTGPCKVAESQELARWRERPHSVIVDTLDMRRFSNLADPSWWTGCWGAGAPMVYGIAMVMSEDGGSLQAGAAGAYDATYRSLAEKLVAGGQGDAWLRLGFEFNGSWFPWRGAADPAAFAAYHRRIVDVMRSVPGNTFRYVWNPTIGLEEFPAEQAWPGTAYVDAIGLDVYDGSWAPGTYPIPAGASPEEARLRREKAWDHYRSMDHGLDWWAAYAARQGKPLALPEWGLVAPEHNGGGDNPLFIQRMREWISANDVVFESYFDAVGAWGDHRLHSGLYPQAAETYRQLFGAAAGAPAVPVTAPVGQVSCTTSSGGTQSAALGVGPAVVCTRG